MVSDNEQKKLTDKIFFESSSQKLRKTLEKISENASRWHFFYRHKNKPKSY